MSGQDDDASGGQWLPIAEAARRLGLSTDAIRKRAQAGSVTARKTDGRWEVWTPTPDVPVAAPDVPPAAPEMPPGARQGAPDDAPDAPDAPVAVAGLVRAHMETLRQLEELRRENQFLSGQVGFQLAQLQQANEQIRLLQAPSPGAGVAVGGVAPVLCWGRSVVAAARHEGPSAPTSGGLRDSCAASPGAPARLGVRAEGAGSLPVVCGRASRDDKVRGSGEPSLRAGR